MPAAPAPRVSTGPPGASEQVRADAPESPGVFAVGVALCPTTPPDPSTAARALGYAHLTCAGLLFAMLATIALFLFTRTDSPGQGPARRLRQPGRAAVADERRHRRQHGHAGDRHGDQQQPA